MSTSLEPGDLVRVTREDIIIKGWHGKIGVVLSYEHAYKIGYWKIFFPLVPEGVILHVSRWNPADIGRIS